MKKSKNILCLLLTLLLIFAAAAPAGASLTPEQWRAYWENDPESHSELIMQPGSDETERRFSWLMPAGTEKCGVLISESPDMSGAREFSGTALGTYLGDLCAKVTVSGLERGKTYYYACLSDARRSAVYSFETLAGNDFTALYVSDVHVSEGEGEGDSLGFERLADAAKSNFGVNIILSGGDQPAGSGSRAEYQGITASPTARGLTFALCQGNHDKDAEYRFLKNVPNEYFGIVNLYQGGDYWFVKGNALFLFINSNNASAVDHRSFVREAVRKNPGAKWRIAVMHHDLYAGTIASRERETRLLRLLFPPIFDEFDIDLVLLGHSHHYSVSDVINGGRSMKKISSGETVLNADGTVYVVASSLFRPRDKGELRYHDEISMGMDNPFTPLYTILDFSENKLTVNTYRYAARELFSGFSLEKDENYTFEGPGFFKRLGSSLAAFLGTAYAFVDNFVKYAALRQKGFDVNIFKTGFKAQSA